MRWPHLLVILAVILAVVLIWKHRDRVLAVFGK